MVTGKSKTNKSYKYGLELGRADAQAGAPCNPTYTEYYNSFKNGGKPIPYKHFKQPLGYYASEIERGYQDGYKEVKDAMEDAHVKN